MLVKRHLPTACRYTLQLVSKLLYCFDFEHLHFFALVLTKSESSSQFPVNSSSMAPAIALRIDSPCSLSRRLVMSSATALARFLRFRRLRLLFFLLPFFLPFLPPFRPLPFRLFPSESSVSELIFVVVVVGAEGKMFSGNFVATSCPLVSTSFKSIARPNFRAQSAFWRLLLLSIE